MLKLNVVMLPALADAVNVKVAETELPAARTEFSRFQATVKYVSAFEGTQLVVVMLNVTGTVPVFLT
jgi:RNase P/RNase MRP subunit POP5